ncbi:sulfotransferase domain-containing protein [Shimia thalassica]|uniref:sulfotransferase domain-containing protein n=1 Tax=Shimia thalassica TaxID=1715693 RepID=UPI0026E26AF7|nr:sulfotransferase domain-containing protein [Shimia thalassica]MDO6523495.1 sulfotransferase domain-containing protein [Shimia thalassica]
MTTVLLRDEFEGQPFEITAEYDQPPENSTFFVGVAKSGSTLLHMIVEDLCDALDERICNISDTCFRAGIPERKLPPSIVPGVTANNKANYYGFRNIGKLMTCPSFREDPKILLVRDPRDALTSLYFSMQKSHSLPKSGRTAEIISEQREKASSMDIDEFVCSGNGDFILFTLNEIASVLWLPNLHVSRYEDIIFKKKEWIQNFCEFAKKPLDDALLDRILEKHDIVPNGEDSSRHIRQVAPGNYLKHLSASSVQYIENKCEKAMTVFGYLDNKTTETRAEL